MTDITILSFYIATTRIIVASVIGTTILILLLAVIVVVAAFFIERQRHKSSYNDKITNLYDNGIANSLYSGGNISKGNSEN